MLTTVQSMYYGKLQGLNVNEKDLGPEMNNWCPLLHVKGSGITSSTAYVIHCTYIHVHTCVHVRTSLPLITAPLCK